MLDASVIPMTVSWTCSNTSLSLLCYGAQHLIHLQRYASPRLSRGRITYLDLLEMFYPSRTWWLLFHFVSSWSACLPGPLTPFLQSCTPADEPPAFTRALVLFLPKRANISITHGWTSWSSFLSISLVCWSPFGWQHIHLVHQKLLPVSHHQQTCWGHILPYHPRH